MTWDDRKGDWLGNVWACLIGRGIDPNAIPDRWYDNAYRDGYSEAAAARVIQIALQLNEAQP